MTLIKAENRELDALDINQPKESQPEHEALARGYYLALTFGTLLSSQRADAQKLDPRGPRHWLDVQHYAGFQQIPTRGAGPADLPVRAAHGEQYTTPEGLCRGVRRPRPGPRPARRKGG
jgi:hypothetical protein